MNLFTQTSLITAVMLVFFLLPRFIERIADFSRYLLLIGTGGLLGFFFFDLIPDVVRVGGVKSVVLIAITWGVYVVLQKLPGFAHGHHHESQHEHENLGPHAHSPGLLFGAMLVHCFSSGMVLALSGPGVFGAMVSHKAYEALSVSLVLHSENRTWRRTGLTAIAYAGAFPLGAWATRCLVNAGMEDRLPWGLSLSTVAMGVASLAVGSILGCLIHDFLVPSFLRVRTHPRESIWLIVGLIATIGATHGH